jgi:hypothetical protein
LRPMATSAFGPFAMAYKRNADGQFPYSSQNESATNTGERSAWVRAASRGLASAVGGYLIYASRKKKSNQGPST